MSCHSEELRILTVHGKGEGPLAVEDLNSLSADPSVAKSLDRSERWPYPRYVGRPRRSLTFGGSGWIFFSTPSEKLERRGGRRGRSGQRGRGRIWRRMEQRLSRGVLLEMEEEDGHGEDQASGGDPPEESDLTAVRRLFEREASKQEQRWRSVQMQLNQLREDVEADRRPSSAPDPAAAPALATAPVAPVTWPRAAIPRLEEDDDI
ncbi:unnamed protein product [Boreogadus saida]